MAKVLIVEDEAMLLVLAESVIQSGGYDTLSASTLSEAEALLDSSGSFDLVFTDLNLGDDKEAGIKIGKLVRDRHPTMPVLYTSGFNLTDGLKELLVDNSEFLAKPYTDVQLVEAMRRDCYPAGIKAASVGGLFHLAVEMFGETTVANKMFAGPLRQ